jgi:hypothetical protein
MSAVRQPLRRMLSHRALVVVGAAFAFVVLAAIAAFAFYSYTDSSNTHVARAAAGSVGTGQQPTATVSGRDVTVSWGAATNASAYNVARANVSPQALSTTEHGTCASSVAGLSCTDTGIVENGTAATNWTYTDTGTLHAWTGPVSPNSATVTVPGPTLSLGTTSFTADGGNTSATVANFFDNEAVTYCVDQSTSCSAGNTLGSDTVPASGGTKTTATITIPAGLSVGSHTVYAIGSSGSLPSVAINVTAGTATQLAFTTQPATNQNVTAGASTSFQVSVEDAHGNVETADNATTVSLAIGNNPGSSTLTCTNTNGTGPVAVTSGVASFTCSLNKAGTGYTLTATSNPAHGTATSNSFNIVASSATTIAISSGANQSATVNTSFTNPLVAQVTDSFSNPVSGATVTFTAPGSGASGTVLAASNGGTCLSSGGSAVASCTATTNASGLASSLTFKANTTAGGYNVAATSAGTTPNPLNFAETNTAGTLNSFTVATPSTQTAGTAFNETITAIDAFGNAASGWTSTTNCVTFSGPSNSPNSTAPIYGSQGACAAGQTSLTFNASGQATASITLFDAQSTTLTVTSVTAPAGKTGTSASFTVNPSTLNSFTVPTPGTQTAGTAFNETITAIDAFGNAASGWTSTTNCVTFSGPSNSPNATAPTYGSQGTCAAGQTSVVLSASGQATVSITLFDAQSTTLTVTSVTAPAGKTGTSASFTINANATNDTMSIVAGNNQSATVGSAFATALQVNIVDQYANPVPNVPVTFTAPASGASGTFANTTNTTTASTNVSGNATASTFTANANTGTYSVTTAASGVASPPSFSLTNTSAGAVTLSATATTNGGSWCAATTWLASAKTGSITTLTTSTAVTGTATSFLSQLDVGNAIYKSDGTTLIGTVASITDNTHLTLTANAASANTAIAYTASHIPTSGDAVTVTLANSKTLTIGTGCAAQAASVSLGNTANNFNNTISFADSTSSLTVYGDVTLNLSSAGATRNLSVGAGTLTVGGNVNLGAGVNSSDNARVTEVSLSTGTVSVNGALVFNATNFASAVPNGSEVVFSGAGTFHLAGGFTVNQNIGTLTPSTGTFDFNGTSAQTISDVSSINFNNVSVSNTSVLTASTALSIGGNFTIASGATFNASTFSHALAGNFTNNGTFNANTSVFTLTGPGATISGSSSTFNNLTLGAAISLSGVDTTVSGTLALGNNTFTTGANKVIANSTVTRGSGFIKGNEQKPIASGSSTPLFEVGTGTTYAPISTSISGANSGGNLTASSTAGQEPNYATSGLSQTKYVNRYWTLIPGGGLTVTGYNATFTFVAGDLVGAPNTATLQVKRDISGTWTAPASSSSTSTTVTGTTFGTTFGNYASGN